MKTLVQFLNEATESKNSPVYRIYRVNIGREGKKDKAIGEITELTGGRYSKYSNTFSYTKMDGGWASAYEEIDAKYGDSKEHFEQGLKQKSNEFFVYTSNKEEAEKVAVKAKNDFKNRPQWTFDSLLKAINSNSALKNSDYTFKHTDSYSQSGGGSKSAKESILVGGGSWRILISDDNYILLQNSGWHTYKIPNIPSLAKVLLANKGDSSDVETERQTYAKLD